MIAMNIKTHREGSWSLYAVVDPGIGPRDDVSALYRIVTPLCELY